MRPIGICIVLGVVALEVGEGLVARVLLGSSYASCSLVVVVLGFVVVVVWGVMVLVENDYVNHFVLS